MPKDDRPTGDSAFSTPDSRARGRWLFDEVVRPTVDYVEGIFDNRPDKPGQAAARKKIGETPLELILPGRFVKAFSETIAGADMPPLVHREDGGRGTGRAERDALEKQRVQREAEQRARELARNPPPVPPGTLVQVVPRRGRTAPEAIARGVVLAAAAGADGPLGIGGHAFLRAALAARGLTPGERLSRSNRSAVGRAIVTKLGLLARRRLVTGPNAGRGNAVAGTGEELELQQWANLEGVDP